MGADGRQRGMIVYTRWDVDRGFNQAHILGLRSPTVATRAPCKGHSEVRNVGRILRRFKRVPTRTAAVGIACGAPYAELRLGHLARPVG